jgi:hypothetical protein
MHRLHANSRSTGTKRRIKLMTGRALTMPGALYGVPRTTGAARFTNLQFFRGSHMAIERRAALAIALAAVSTYASAAPVAFEGRYYEVVAASGISWNDANTAANARTHLGVHGHLATINTAAEDAFVDSLNVPTGNRTELWIGVSGDAPRSPDAAGSGSTASPSRHQHRLPHTNLGDRPARQLEFRTAPVHRPQRLDWIRQEQRDLGVTSSSTAIRSPVRRRTLPGEHADRLQPDTRARAMTASSSSCPPARSSRLAISTRFDLDRR